MGKSEYYMLVDEQEDKAFSLSTPKLRDRFILSSWIARLRQRGTIVRPKDVPQRVHTEVISDLNSSTLARTGPEKMHTAWSWLATDNIGWGCCVCL
ncbi:hypothetical protein AcW1_008537 [Taiwanofungus camphoratus]|nr:hypothetical protein AcV5_008822 [Antrodia cinnamomea]KAI0951503.1 hypothetical protein AcW1_008537 [Antrodia cinnamomea]KAI0956401.1 hypothetical protein AcV7_006819 [Antrodia cinnamomea]